MKKIINSILLLAGLAIAAPQVHAQVSVGLSVRIGPPAIPVYEQPICPTDGYIWTPGYWAYGDGGYYWVPGAWVAPPSVGVLWTPAWWGYDGGVYAFHSGYWGPHVGFYGGINYGFGYGGVGFGGGMWEGGHFRYNTAVLNVNRTVIHNTYVDRTVIVNNRVNRTSFNGPGGVNAKPRPEDMAAMKEQHVPATANQMQHEQHASQNKNQFASVNRGRPAAAAMNKVGGTHFNPQGQKAPARANQNNFNKQQKQQQRTQLRQQRQQQAKPEGKRP